MWSARVKGVSIICTVHLRAWLKMDLSYSYESFSYLRTNDPILGQFTSLIRSYLSKEFRINAFRRSVVEKESEIIEWLHSRHIVARPIKIYSCSWKDETTDSRNRQWAKQQLERTRDVFDFLMEFQSSSVGNFHWFPLNRYRFPREQRDGCKDAFLGKGTAGVQGEIEVPAHTIVRRHRRRLRRRSRRSSSGELCNFNYFISGNPSNIQRKEGTGGGVSRGHFSHAQRNPFAVVVASIFLPSSFFSAMPSPRSLPSPAPAPFHLWICRHFHGFTPLFNGQRPHLSLSMINFRMCCEQRSYFLTDNRLRCLQRTTACPLINPLRTNFLTETWK